MMVAVLALGLAGGAIATRAGRVKLRRARRVLADIRLVDGAGSGLDADTVQGLKPLMVVDGNGKFVGAVIDAPLGFTSAEIVRRLGNVSVRMSVNAGGFSNDFFTADDGPYFESSDCSGPMLIRAREGLGLFYPPTALVFGTTAYYVPEGTTRSANSKAQFGTSQADCQNGGVFVPPMFCCSPGVSNIFLLGPAVSFDLTTLGLAPPFHLDIPTDVSTPATTTTTTTTPQTP